MTKRMWALMATFVVVLAFPAAGVTKQQGGTLNMIAGRATSNRSG